MKFIYDIHNMSDLFETNKPDELVKKIKDYFSAAGIEVEVTAGDDAVSVELPSIDESSIEAEFQSIAGLCQQGKMKDAEPLLDDFIKNHPLYSEAHRIKAQMTMEKGDIDKAIDLNIEALRCNPQNSWALLLMGNLLCKYKKDFETARKYYDSVLKYDPQNSIAVNNIAAVMMELGKYKEAIPMFKQVLENDKKYANAYYGLALCHYNLKDFTTAFAVARQGSVTADRRTENPTVLEELHKVMVASAHALMDGVNFMNVFLGIKDLIESESHQEVVIEEDKNLNVSAQLKYGPVYHRRNHIIKYNPSIPFMPHLGVHELMHLEMSIEASKSGKNRIVFTNADNTSAFRSRYASWINKLIKKIGHSKAMDVAEQVHGGIVLQLMNCPLDLFVEKRMFDKYPTMRPLQLLSLMQQEDYNVKAILESEKRKFIPQDIVTMSKVMNIVTSMHVEKLFGLRFYQMYKPTKKEFEMAKDLYEEYEAYDDYKPGEEYDLVEYFAQTFNAESLISMKPESEYIRESVDKMLNDDAEREAILGPNVPKGGNSYDGLTEEQKKNQDTFFEQNKDGEDPMKTMMMSMYMLGALEYFEGKTKDEIRTTAMEIAMKGVTGISPDKKSGYSVPSIPGKDFGGYQFLAYYYVSWALAIPEKLAALNFPFDTAWKTAQEMYKRRKGQS